MSRGAGPQAPRCSGPAPRTRWRCFLPPAERCGRQPPGAWLLRLGQAWACWGWGWGVGGEGKWPSEQSWKELETTTYHLFRACEHPWNPSPLLLKRCKSGEMISCMAAGCFPRTLILNRREAFASDTARPSSCCSEVAPNQTPPRAAKGDLSSREDS